MFSSAVSYISLCISVGLTTLQTYSADLLVTIANVCYYTGTAINVNTNYFEYFVTVPKN